MRRHAAHDIPPFTHIEHAKSISETAVATSQCALDLIAVEVPLDERPVALLVQKPVHLPVRLDEAHQRWVQLHADLVPRLCDLLANRHQYGRTPLRQPEAR